jgi:hypothetical protein
LGGDGLSVSIDHAESGKRLLESTAKLGRGDSMASA